MDPSNASPQPVYARKLKAREVSPEPQRPESSAAARSRARDSSPAPGEPACRDDRDEYRRVNNIQIACRSLCVVGFSTRSPVLVTEQCFVHAQAVAVVYDFLMNSPDFPGEGADVATILAYFHKIGWGIPVELAKCMWHYVLTFLELRSMTNFPGLTHDQLMIN